MPAGMTCVISCHLWQQAVLVVLTAPLCPLKQHAGVSPSEGWLLPKGWRASGDPSPVLLSSEAGDQKKVHPQPPHEGLLLGTSPLCFCNILREGLVSGYSS